MTTSLTKTDQKPAFMRRVRLWVNRLAFTLIIVTPLIFLVAALGYKLGVIGLGTSFGTLNQKIGLPALLVTLGAGLIGLALGILIKPRKGLLVSLVAIAVPAAGIKFATSVKSTAQSLPFIHDVTTDMQDPPMFTSAILDERAKTKGVNSAEYLGKRDVKNKKLFSELQAKGYPEIKPVQYTDAPQVIFDRAKSAVKSMGLKLKSENAQSGIIEATDTTFWYGFKDDVIIRIRPLSSGGSVMDIRSVSRVGASDIGINAARIHEIIDTIGD